MGLGALEGLIFFLDAPAVLAGLALGLAGGAAIHAVAQLLAARLLGVGPTGLAGRYVGRRFSNLSLRRLIDPFGVVAMVLAGPVWTHAALSGPPRGRRNRWLLAVLAGPAAVLLVAAAAAASLRVTSSRLLAAAVIGLVVAAVIHVIPLPPLDGWLVLSAYAPRSPGWDRARTRLVEDNWGIAILLGLLLPLFSGRGLLTRVVIEIGEPVVRALAQLAA